MVHTPDVLTLSAEDEVGEVLSGLLRVSKPREMLELWTENLREWLSGRALRPLVAQVHRAHEPVNQVRGAKACWKLDRLGRREGAGQCGRLGRWVGRAGGQGSVWGGLALWRLVRRCTTHPVNTG